jgi:hypothetical protein
MQALQLYQLDFKISDELYDQLIHDSDVERNQLLARILSGKDTKYNPEGRDFLGDAFGGSDRGESLRDPSGELYKISVSKGKSEEVLFEIQSSRSPITGRIKSLHEFELRPK